MSLEIPHPGARGGRAAKRANDREKEQDRLIALGVISSHQTASERAQAEALHCPICNQAVHPTNWSAHMDQKHKKKVVPLHEADPGRLSLTVIRIDGGTQPRGSTDGGIVDEYADAMREGNPFPPVTIFYDGKDYWLADGFHRYFAARKAELTDIAAEVRQGTQRDAILFSVGANANHGLRRTTFDKRRAVVRLLTDDEWVKWSDREIARRCAVSDRFVNNVRKEVVTANGSQLERTYMTKHGTQATMNTANIGKSSALVKAEQEREAGLGGRGAQVCHMGNKNVVIGTLNRIEGTTAYVDSPDGFRMFTYKSLVPFDPTPTSLPSARVTYGQIEDDYVPDVGEVQVEETAPETEETWEEARLKPPKNGRYSENEAEWQLGGRGATVKLKNSGMLGTLAFAVGRIAYVDTVNGRREYYVDSVLPVPDEVAPSTVDPIEKARQEQDALYERIDNFKTTSKITRPATPTESQPNDRCQTPPYALDPILPYLQWSAESTIWEPAAGEGLIVEALYTAGWKPERVIASDILTGQNFFDYDPQRWDIIVTNPPYSMKLEWLERCYALGRPFALLVPGEFLFTGGAYELTKAHGFEMMILDSRVDFKMPNRGWDGTATFPTFWLCWNLLPQKVMYGSIKAEKRAFKAEMGVADDDDSE